VLGKKEHLVPKLADLNIFWVFIGLGVYLYRVPCKQRLLRRACGAREPSIIAEESAMDVVATMSNPAKSALAMRILFDLRWP
jgi:hypothetical protein